MSDLRNPCEKAVHELLIWAIQEFTMERMSKTAYMDAMSYLRDAERLLLNRRYGCESGKHAGSDCECPSGAEVPISRATRTYP